jgi:sugar/nucleoside kinase (ribokinase family)
VDWPAVCRRTLPHVDLFTPSVEELTFMLRRETFEQLTARAGDAELLGFIDGELLGELGEACIDAGAAVVMIKCGYLGIYLRTAGADRLAKLGRATVGDAARWADRELFEPSYKVDRIVSATGAGDCAIAAFLTGFLRGDDAADCLRCACAVGAQNLAAADSITGVRTWEETVAQIAARPEKRPVEVPLEGWTFDEQADHYRGPRDSA